MVVVNPVQDAANWFLAFLNTLPIPVVLLVYAFFGFWVISAIVQIIRH